MKRMFLVVYWFILLSCVNNAYAIFPRVLGQVVDATNVYIIDAGGIFTANTVEQALNELYNRGLSSTTIETSYLLLTGTNAVQNINLGAYGITGSSLTFSILITTSARILIDTNTYTTGYSSSANVFSDDGYTFGDGTKQTTAASSTPPGGSDTELQFNNSSSFGGISGFTYNGTTVSVTIPFLVSEITVSTINATAGTGGVAISTDIITSINISNASPEIRITNTGSDSYTNITKSATDNIAKRFNKVNVPAGPGNAADLSGTAQHYDCGDIDVRGDLTITAWVNVDDIASTSRIFGRATTAAASDNQYWFEVSANDMRMIVSNGSSNFIGLSNNSIAAGSWRFVVGRYNDSSGLVDVYVNDVKNSGGATLTGSQNLVAVNDFMGTIGGASGGFKGLLDEVAIYNKVLSEGEMTTLYNAGVGRYGLATDDGLVAGWHLDESAGNADNFEGTVAYDGILTAGTYVEGKVQSPDVMLEVVIWESEDGSISGETGIQKYGNSAGETTIRGREILFNTNGANRGTIDNEGNWNIDSSSVIVTGNLTVNGTFYYNTSYGEIFLDENMAGTTVTADTMTFVSIEGSYTTGQLNGFTVLGSSLTYTGLGGASKLFLVNVSISFTSDTNSTLTHIGIFRNGVQDDDSLAIRKVGTGGDFGNLGITDIEPLSTNDILQLRMSSDKNAVITIEHMNFNIVQIN